MGDVYTFCLWKWEWECLWERRWEMRTRLTRWEVLCKSTHGHEDPEVTSSMFPSHIRVNQSDLALEKPWVPPQPKGCLSPVHPAEDSSPEALCLGINHTSPHPPPFTRSSNIQYLGFENHSNSLRCDHKTKVRLLTSNYLIFLRYLRENTMEPQPNSEAHFVSL